MSLLSSSTCVLNQLDSSRDLPPRSWYLSINIVALLGASRDNLNKGYRII